MALCPAHIGLCLWRARWSSTAGAIRRNLLPRSSSQWGVKKGIVKKEHSHTYIVMQTKVVLSELNSFRQCLTSICLQLGCDAPRHLINLPKTSCLSTCNLPDTFPRIFGKLLQGLYGGKDLLFNNNQADVKCYPFSERTSFPSRILHLCNCLSYCKRS